MRASGRKSAARQHAEWLSLVEVSGPFLSMPVLQRVFPQGLDAHDPDHARDLRALHEEWESTVRASEPEPAAHRAWLRFVLENTLELPHEVLREGQSLPPGLEAQLAEHQETLRPDLAVVSPPGAPDAGKPRLLIQLVAPGQTLDKPLAGRRWKASPATRMAELLRGCQLRLGLVTNGEDWMLVDAPAGETAGFVTWQATLWREEPLTLRAFRSLLGVRRFFGVAEADTLDALLAESARDQEAVTDQLGLQVRRAVEVLVQAIDRLDRDAGRKLLRGADEKALYDSAVTVMMRLVFLFFAEENGLLPASDALYQESYAVSTLRDALRRMADQHGEEVLERRSDAWARLLSTFRAVFGGIEHEALRLPAYGGTLFDPDRFPFLEGRAQGTSWRDTAARTLPVDNRTVLHLLEALQILEVRVGSGPPEARRLSFRGLDIEQIGHVYEGLLDHTAVRASEPVLGLSGAKGLEPEVPLSELERSRRNGREALADLVRERTGRSKSAIDSALEYDVGDESGGFLVACESDRDLYARVKPFAGLVRDDTFGRPIVIPEGSVFVTAGTERRSTGTYYTPRSLTEELVRYALEPLVYEGPADGKPPAEWKLRPAREILALRVCDLAMGSGAFLVQTCRYLAELLVEAWDAVEEGSPGRVVVTPEGDLSSGGPGERPIPRDPEERLAIARRAVVDRCLFGVDKNPQAVEMAKLSLWLITLQRDRPFTFLDHALRCGDSLVGVTALEQITRFHVDPGPGHQLVSFAGACAPALERALALRRRIESFEVVELRDAEEKARLLGEAEAALEDVRLIADLVVGAALATAGGSASAQEELIADLADRVGGMLDPSIADETAASRRRRLHQRAQELLDTGLPEGLESRRPMHWALEFPEVVASDGTRRGFDVIVSNPPFQGGQKITGALGTAYRDFLVEHIARGTRGSADLCAYFYLRAGLLLAEQGGFAMLATNTIAQGDTREVGLDQLVERGFAIQRAVSSRKWPGSANLEVAEVWVRRGGWRGEHSLDDRVVGGITPLLTEPGKVTGKPFRLAANAGKSFIGSYVLGMGFVMTPEAAEALIRKDERNRDVLFPYLNGEDLNSRWDQSPSRWVINFRDWPLDRRSAPEGYDGPVAADYPGCLEIVRTKVKPERDRNKRKPRRERWWQYAERAPDLYATIAGMDRVLVRARVSGTHSIAFVPTSWVLNEQLVVFALSTAAELAILQSSIHESWAREFASSMRTDLRYGPSDCFETYPFPAHEALKVIGALYEAERTATMTAVREGLTKTYNRLHDRTEPPPTVRQLRNLHVEMDRAVADAYGWSDLDLQHGFHETKQGLRFTISEHARREVLARLLALNHARHAEEAARGLVGTPKQSAKPKARPNGEAASPTTMEMNQRELF